MTELSENNTMLNLLLIRPCNLTWILSNSLPNGIYKLKVFIFCVLSLFWLFIFVLFEVCLIYYVNCIKYETTIVKRRSSDTKHGKSTSLFINHLSIVEVIYLVEKFLFSSSIEQSTLPKTTRKKSALSACHTMELDANSPAEEPFIWRILSVLHRYFCIFLRFIMVKLYDERGQSMLPIDNRLLLEPATSIAEMIRTKQASKSTNENVLVKSGKQLSVFRCLGFSGASDEHLHSTHQAN